MQEFFVKVGDRVSFAKTVGETDIYLFAGITGDFSVNHVNEQYMARSKFGRRIAHGALIVGYMSTCSTMMIDKCQGATLDTTPVSLGYDRVRFLAPVFIGDTVTLTYTIAEVALAGDVERMIAATVARFHRLDILVNNAGYGIAGTVVETPQEAWDALMATNVRGVFLCSKYAIPVMQRTGGGTIVNTASVVAAVGIANRAAYCASKGAVASLTRAIAIDHVGDGIRCNAIAPGTIDTPYFDEILKKSTDPEATRKALAARQLLGRLGTAEEIAAGILFLASDESRFATGTILTLDGGMTAQ